MNTIRTVRISPILYRVESETIRGKFYTVIVRDNINPSSCNCPEFINLNNKNSPCVHMLKVKESIEYENSVSGARGSENNVNSYNTHNI